MPVDDRAVDRAAGETRSHRIERRRLLALSFRGAGLVAGGAFGASLIELLTGTAYAGAPTDVQAGQTAASIDNLMLEAYRQVASLPFVKALPAPAGPLLRAFLDQTVWQHAEHAKAFNDAVEALGAKAQSGPDQALLTGTVQPGLPGVKSPLDAVKFLAELELVAAETYATQTTTVTNRVMRNTFAGISGVEAQHRATLLMVGALLEHNVPQLIAIPTKAASLPAEVGAAGFPDAFLPLDRARGGAEGARP